MSRKTADAISARRGEAGAMGSTANLVQKEKALESKSMRLCSHTPSHPDLRRGSQEL
jgi:hypothetical protein